MVMSKEVDTSPHRSPVDAGADSAKAIAASVERIERMENPALRALMIKLRPRAMGSILPNAGQLAHAALLRWLAEVDPTLAARLHEPNQDRPFTCSSLWFPQERAIALAQRENRRLPVSPGQTYWLRLTMLTDEVFLTLLSRLAQSGGTDSADDASGSQAGTPESVGLPTLRLGSVHFEVAELLTMVPDRVAHAERAGNQPEQWAGYDTYRGLVARAQAVTFGAADERNITLEFQAPTAFSDGQVGWGKRMHLFPNADRVFDRLARVWNTWAPADLALDTRAVQAYAREWATVANFDLRTHLLHFDRHTQLGFVGRCTYAVMEREQRAIDASAYENVGANLHAGQALHLLASFAFYAGIGQKTTMGMGQARPLAPRRNQAEAHAAS